MTLLNAGYETRAFYEKILNGLPTGMVGNWLCMALLSLRHEVETPSLNSVLVAIESRMGCRWCRPERQRATRCNSIEGSGWNRRWLFSLYSWENAGDICVLVELTSRVRSKRNTSPKPA